MQHERLPDVPRLCEVCYSPVVAAPFHVVFVWPGSHGLAVYIHPGDCYRIALDRMRRANRPRT